MCKALLQVSTPDFILLTVSNFLFQTLAFCNAFCIICGHDTGMLKSSAHLTLRAASQVGLAIPSIKAALSDREFALITSVAGANVAEALRIPASALWLEEHVMQGASERDDADASGQVRNCQCEYYVERMRSFCRSCLARE